MNYEIKFLQALILTVTVECGVIVALLRFFPALWQHKIPLAKTVAAGVIPSIATLPYLWFVTPALLHSFYLQVIAGELAVFLVETVIIFFIVNLPLRWCALLSFIANVTSILAGLLVFR